MLTEFRGPTSRNLAVNLLVRNCQRNANFHVRKIVVDYHAATGCASER